MIRARLVSGEVVSLEKDCNCVIHEGPHWLHMDDVDKRLNQSLRNRAVTGEPLAVRAYAQSELKRLGEKRREMERRGIEEIFSRLK